MPLGSFTASRDLPSAPPAEGFVRRAPYTLHPEEHRTGFEPAQYLLGRQAGSQLPNRCIINLVEVSGFYPGNEHCPIPATPTGFEPASFTSTGCCSTVELRGLVRCVAVDLMLYRSLSDCHGNHIVWTIPAAAGAMPAVRFTCVAPVLTFPRSHFSVQHHAPLSLPIPRQSRLRNAQAAVSAAGLEPAAVSA